MVYSVNMIYRFAEMQSFIDAVHERHSKGAKWYRQAEYARLIGISRQGVPKHCKNNLNVHIFVHRQFNLVAVDKGNQL